MNKDRHLKYNEIPEFQFFTEDLFSLTSTAISPEELHDLFEIIGVQDSIDNLLQVIDNFSRICNTISSICLQPKWLKVADKISDLADTAKAILEHQDILAKQLTCIGAPLNKKTNDAFYGLTESAPLYVTLGFLPEDRSHLDRYFQLIAHILIARIVLIEKQQLQDTSPILLDTLVEIRRVARKKTLKNHPATILDPASYFNKLLPISQKEQLTSSCLLLSAALSHLTTTGLDKLAERIHTDPPDPIILISRRKDDLTQDSVFHLREEQHHPQNDLSPAPDGLVYFFPSTGKKTSTKQDLHYVAKQIAGSRAMEHQIFVNAWDNLNQCDITLLLDYLFSSADCHTYESIAIKVAIGLMLFAGFPAKRLCNIKIGNEDLPFDNIDCYCSKTKSLRLVTTGPEYKGTISTECINQSCPCQQFIDLTLPSRLTDIIDLYLQFSISSLDNNLFTLSTGQINGAVNSVFSRLKYGHKKRLTPVRVQKYMAEIISRLPGCDIATASLILGKQLYLARTPIFYATFDLDSMRHKYNLACQQILQEGGYQYPVQQPYPSSCNYLGSRTRPQLSVVKKLIEDLQQQVNIPAKRFNSIEQLAGYHNAYTMYTWVMVVYSSGYRAVNMPYITADMVDDNSGFAVIRDKDSDDFFHSRLVYLPECCRIQLRHYNNHIKQILSLSSSSPEGKASQFFFMDPTTGSFVYPRRKQISSQLQQYNFQLPANVQRHFLKSELQENGCNVEAIELFLGHWSIGQEGWVETSALNPCDYRDEIQKYLPPLLRSLNLIPIAGLKSSPKIELTTPLSQWLVPEAKKRCQALPANTIAQFTGSQPAYIWNNDKDSNSHTQIEKLSQPQLFVLSKVRELAPALYNGNVAAKVDNSVLLQLFNSLKPKTGKPAITNERLCFYINALERGKKDFGWQINIPHQPIVLPKGYNRIRPAVMTLLDKYRSIEQAFIADLSQPLPEDTLLQLGQIVVSAILYGGINHPVWADAFWQGLNNSWCYQWKDVIWVDLWSDKKPASAPDQWDLQRNATQYRRWLADPLTHILLNRWKKSASTCDKINATTLTQVYNHYDRYLRRNGTTLPPLKQLLKCGNAWATLHVPPFLSAYMANRTTSSSLPDPVWMRLLTGKHYPSAYKPRQTVKSRATNRSSSDGSAIQIALIKELCQGLTARKLHSKDKIIAFIESFIEKNSSSLCCCAYLLASWAIQLLSSRQSTLELRQRKPEKVSTAVDYVTTISSELLVVTSTADLYTLDDAELHDLLSTVLERTIAVHVEKANTTNALNRLHYIIERLKQFFGFTHVFYDLPLLTIESDGANAFVNNGVAVRANLMTMTEFERLKQLLGWRNKKLNREQRMAIVWAILAFRAGLRVSEIYGLMIGDVQGNDKLELLIQKNNFRDLKSAASQRRIPLYTLLPESELDFIKKWHQYRDGELGSTLKSPLFTILPLEVLPCSRDIVLKVLAPAIKQVTGDMSMTVHGLRHSFASWMLLKIINNKNCSIKHAPEFLCSNEFDPLKTEQLKTHLLANDNTINRKALYLVANILGHADTETEITNYMHLCDWLCWQHLHHPACLPPLTATTVANLTVSSKANAYKIIKKDGNCLADYVSKLPAIFPSHPLLSSAIAVSAVTQTANNNNDHNFDVCLHRTYFQHKYDYNHWPKSATEVQILRHWYNILRCSISDKKLQQTAQLLMKSYVRRSHTFVFYATDEAKLATDLLLRIGAIYHCQYYPSRWHSATQSNNSHQTWAQALKQKIKTGNHTSGRNSKNGKLCIIISEIGNGDDDIRVLCDVTVYDLIFTLLLCLADCRMQ